MAEEKKLTVLQRQQLIKPKPEDIILEFFNGDAKENALDFVTWLRENDLMPRWDGVYRWKVNYKGQYICYLNIFYPANGSWKVNLNRLFWGEYEKYITDNEMKKFVLDNIGIPGCKRECGRKKDVTFLGEHFDEVCACWPFPIKNPDWENLDYLKKLILLSRDILTDLKMARSNK